VILNATKSESESLPGARKAAMLLIVLGEQTSAELLRHLSE
jgi:flagellar motor switch protein FliG